MSTDNDRLLLVLGRIEGRMDEVSRNQQVTQDTMRRIEERVLATLKDHDERLRKVETDAARESGRRGAVAGAIAGTGASGLAHMLIEAFKHLLR